MNRSAAALLLLSLMIACCLASAQTQESEYVVSQSLKLTNSADGIDGTLDVLIDARIESNLRTQMWGVGDWNFVLHENGPKYLEFKNREPKNANASYAYGRASTSIAIFRPESL